MSDSSNETSGNETSGNETSSDEVMIRIGLPLPMDVVGHLLEAIGSMWPEAVAKANSEYPNDLCIVLRGSVVSEADGEDVEESSYSYRDGWPYAACPELYLGDLCGPNGNAFFVRAICKQAIEDCDFLEAEEEAGFLNEFLTRIRPLAYGEAMDFIREIFDWQDDIWKDDPRFSARAKSAGMPVPA